MNCRDVQNKLSAFLDQETTTEENRLIRSHLYDCSGCECELQALTRLKNMLEEFPIEEPSCDLEQRLFAAIGRECNRIEPTHNVKSVLVPVGLVATSFTVAFLGWLMVSRLTPSNEPSNNRFEADRHQATEGFSDPFSPVPNVMSTSYDQR